MMRMAGFFPSVPSQVNFELMFAPVEGQWRVFGISVKVGSSAPAPPTPAPAAPPQPQAAAVKKPPAAKPASKEASPTNPSGKEGTSR
jgi:hypothetical protein